MDNGNEDVTKSFNKIALLHKIYGWLLILLASIATILIAFGFSFGALLMAFNLNNLGQAVIESYYVGLFITFIFGFFNLFVAIKLKEQSRLALSLSLFSLSVMLLIRGTTVDYFFAVAIILTWVFHFEKAKYLLYATPLLVVFGMYYGYTIFKSNQAKEFCSAVYYAASYDELKAMLDRGIDPNIQDAREMTPLFYAKDPRKAELLLNYGANPNYETSIKSTPLFSLMIRKETLKDFFSILVHHGANINHQDIHGNTVLHVGLSLGRNGIIESVLPHKPNLFIKNNNGMTAIDIARQQSSSQYKILLKYVEETKGITNQRRAIKKPPAGF